METINLPQNNKPPLRSAWPNHVSVIRFFFMFCTRCLDVLYVLLWQHQAKPDAPHQSIKPPMPNNYMDFLCINTQNYKPPYLVKPARMKSRAATHAHTQPHTHTHSLGATRLSSNTKNTEAELPSFRHQFLITKQQKIV